MNAKKLLTGVACVLIVAPALIMALRKERAIKRPPMPHPPAQEMRFSPRQRPPTGPNAARDFSDAIANAVERVMPSVVVIRTDDVKIKKESYSLDPFGIYHGFRDVEQESQGEGSGVIIDERGYVLTSWHVLENAVGGEVLLNNGKSKSGTLVGYDEATDLAVIKITEPDLDFQAVEFADSERVRVGEVAIAIGSPFRLQSTVTVGHVSQKGRKVNILPYEDFIQTDAAINEGNSGGPLINADGRLIGINTAKKTNAQQRGVGIAFAVPSNLAMVVAKSIIETAESKKYGEWGVHEWPWLGASFATAIEPERSQKYNGAGVIILKVWGNTPAARMGLHPNTAVLEVDGVTVHSVQDVERHIFNKSVGEEIRLKLQEIGKKPFLTVLQLERYPGKTT